MSTPLQRGEKRTLASLGLDSPLALELRGDLPGLTLTVLGLSGERTFADTRYLISGARPGSPEGAVQLAPDGLGLSLDPARLPPTVRRLVLAASAAQPFSRAGALTLAVTGRSGQGADIALRGADFGEERAVVLAEIYEHQGEWRLSSVGQGHAGGLAALLDSFGVLPGQLPAEQAAPPPAPQGPGSGAPVGGTPVGAGGGPGIGADGTYSLEQFVSNTAEADRPGEAFELESHKLLEVKVQGLVWSKLGAVVAHRGNLTFRRQGMLEGGVMKALMRAVSQEMEPLAKIEGQGTCYLADQNKNLTVIRLVGDALNVSGHSLLAFQDTVSHDITTHRSVAGMVAGGLFSVRLQGQGLVALASHGPPLTLRVTPGDPVVTDPNATIAWSDRLAPQIRVDASLRSIIGRGGGESLQMVFQGEGFVVVQPYEESLGGGGS